MTPRTYASPEAFKQALEQRLRSSAKTGAEFARKRQLLVFDRFLARIALVLGDAATLKGGLVLELRLERARTTTDVDLRMVGSLALADRSGLDARSDGGRGSGRALEAHHDRASFHARCERGRTVLHVPHAIARPVRHGVPAAQLGPFEQLAREHPHRARRREHARSDQLAAGRELERRLRLAWAAQREPGPEHCRRGRRARAVVPVASAVVLEIARALAPGLDAGLRRSVVAQGDHADRARRAFPPIGAQPIGALCLRVVGAARGSLRGHRPRYAGACSQCGDEDDRELHETHRTPSLARATDGQYPGVAHADPELVVDPLRVRSFRHTERSGRLPISSRHAVPMLT